MADLYVATGVKRQESCKEDLIEDGVANGAKRLGRISDTEFSAYMYFDLAASPFRKNVK
jgi:hypothetical protein